ncbi:MAG TPA: 6-phosphogluconolactonase [Mycobacteriales bacterium]
MVLGTAELLAAAAAARLVTALVDAQAAYGVASVVLTGGRVGGAVLRAVRDSPARDAVDWGRVEFWWGDERWLPIGDPERNDRQAQDALLSAVPVDPARVHPFPAADGRYAGDPEKAAAVYAAELAAAGPPRFDVLMLGVGEEGHVASIFPDSPAAHDTGTVAAVRDSPKPPPIRLTLTFPTINSATEVWLMAAGAEKAGAVAQALGGATGLQVPAAGVHGTARTRWLLDTAAAGKLPG